MRMRFLPALLLALSWWVGSAKADVRLPSIFSDNAVLQADRMINVWGWADAGEKVAVTIGELRSLVVADKNGNWSVKLGPFKGGAKVTFSVQGKNRINLKNVIVGEAWLCSGQSNMAMNVQRSKDFEKEQKKANFPNIRTFKVTANPQTTPQANCSGKWIVCSPETVGQFTATGYFFGREIHTATGKPVGLINSSVGGTAIEAWTSMDVQKNNPKLKPIFDTWNQMEQKYDAKKAQAQYEMQLAKWKVAAAKAKADGKRPPRRPRQPVQPIKDRNHPSNLFNGMIAPLIPYTIRGAIWYQGERNSRTLELAQLYREQLPLLIKDWRKRFDQGDFPFLFVQLPNFKAPVDAPVQEDSTWALIRESFAESLRVPKTGMAITIDVGEAKDIHPKNKQAVGFRLAQLALAHEYALKVKSVMGPIYKSHQVKDGKVMIELTTDAKLVSKDGKPLREFALKSEEGKWVAGNAEIVGPTTIQVSHPQVKKPVAVRYAWKDNPAVNLYDAAGLPASPFRTDK